MPDGLHATELSADAARRAVPRVTDDTLRQKVRMVLPDAEFVVLPMTVPLW